MPKVSKTILIVEPNEALTIPYAYFPPSYQTTRVNNVPAALAWLSSHQPDLFVSSASFSPSLQLQLLETFKNNFREQIIPLIFVVDLSQPLSYIPGTGWGDRLGILHSQQTARNCQSLLKILL